MTADSRKLWRILANLFLAAALGSCVSFQENMLSAQQAAASLNSAAQRDTADELFNAGEYQEAISVYDQVLAADPQDYYAYGQRGECYRMLSRYDEAIADFTRAIELNPDNYWSIANRGESYRAKGEYDLAIQDLDRALELHPDYAWALGSRADAWRLKNEYDRASATS
jgi:tetratricopeptide (TPR) repeat protein